jgi:hypothetical protein
MMRSDLLCQPRMGQWSRRLSVPQSNRFPPSPVLPQLRISSVLSAPVSLLLAGRRRMAVRLGVEEYVARKLGFQLFKLR